MCKSIVGQANINAQELQNIKILIPPVELQNAYQKKLDIVKNLKNITFTTLQKTDDIFNGLLQKAFNGHLIV